MAEFVKKNCVALATGGGNNIYFATATGSVLAAVSTNGKGPFDQFFDPSMALAKFNQLPEDERQPKKLEPSEFFDRLNSTAPVPSGMLVCRQYSRAFERGRQDTKGDLRRHEGQSTNNLGPNGDFLWLTEAEWKSLVPASPMQGMKHPVPDAISRRIFVYHLSNTSLGASPGWTPEQFRSGELTLTVEEASAAGVRLHLEGFARLADNADFAKATQKAEFSLVGSLNYDAEKKVFDRFDIVALGEVTPFIGTKGSTHTPRKAATLKERTDGASGTLGIAFELAAPDSLGYGVRPARHYFAPHGASPKPGT